MKAPIAPNELRARADAKPPVRSRRPLARRIAVAVAMKLALLAVLYLLFFSPSHRPRIDDAAVDEHLLPTR